MGHGTYFVVSAFDGFLASSWFRCVCLSLTKVNLWVEISTIDIDVNFDFSLSRLPAKTRRRCLPNHTVCWQQLPIKWKFCSCIAIKGHSQPCTMVWQMVLLDALHLDFLFIFLILNCTVDPCFPFLSRPSALSWSGILCYKSFGLSHFRLGQ